MFLLGRLHQLGSSGLGSSRNEEDAPLDDEEDDLINPGSPTPFEDEISEDDTSFENPPEDQSPLGEAQSSVRTPVKSPTNSDGAEAVTTRLSPTPSRKSHRKTPSSSDEVDHSVKNEEHEAAKKKFQATFATGFFKDFFPLSSSEHHPKLEHHHHPVTSASSPTSTASSSSSQSSATNAPQTSVPPSLSIESLVSGQNKRPGSPLEPFFSPIRPIPERFTAGFAGMFPPLNKRPFTLGSLAMFQHSPDKFFLPSSGAFRPIRLPNAPDPNPTEES